MVEVCLLGTGGMMPLPDRRLTAMLYRHNGKMILVDCGEGTQIPVKMAGWGFKAIDAICFTHYHADHIVGLTGFLLTLGNSGREAPLTIFGPPGLFEVIKGLTVITPVLPYDIKLVELPDKEESTNYLGDIVIKSRPVDHWIPCLAYSLEIKRAGRFDVKRAREKNIPVEYWGRLQKGETIEYNNELLTSDMVLGEQRKGIKVSYCTDTRPLPEIIYFIRDSNLFICEGMYGEENMLEKAVEKKHMLFSEAGQLAEIGKVKEMWLTHYSPSMEKPEIFLENARKHFPNTYAGIDLMMKSIVFEESE